MTTLIATAWLAATLFGGPPSSGPFGGPCIYTDTPGVATIVSVTPAEPGDLNCWNDPVVVLFDYYPNPPASPALAAAGVALTIGEGLNPPLSWIEAEGLTVGTQHKCRRRDITSGTCTPLLFDFPGVDYAAGLKKCYAATTFALTVFPLHVMDSIVGQDIVLLATVCDQGPPMADEPVHITATAIGADIIIDPPDIWPGQVCEITVTPTTLPVEAAEPRNAPRIECIFGAAIMPVELCATRGGCERTQEITICVLPGEDGLLAEATQVRERFIPYFAASWPQLGIDAGTVWHGTIVKPHFLVVSHYLFFSDEWELGLQWHHMIPPYDWVHAYLRPRYTHMQPLYGFQIDSLSAEPPQDPYPVPPPPEVDR